MIQLLTAKEAAQYKGMGYEAFHYYIRKNRGPVGEKKGGRWFFERSALDEWVLSEHKLPCGGYRPRKKKPPVSA